VVEHINDEADQRAEQFQIGWDVAKHRDIIGPASAALQDVV
jgi:hypothetical protein